MFDPVDPKQDFIELEHRILDFWRGEEIFEARMRHNAGRAHWSFIDGPITANNPMGVHHAWGRTYKDVYQRFKAMQGFDQRWQNGFDCQGLWLEVETERELGFNSKRDIENHGLDKFSRACRARVDKFSAIQTQQSIRLGQWMRWDDSYYTMSDTNIEYIWHFLHICHGKGWLYEGHKAMPWCTRCGTSLSQHELADGYEEVADTSVFLRFPLRERPGQSLLVWTTTPWTLTANVAAAVNPELAYARVRYRDHDYWISAALVEPIFRKDGVVLETVKGGAMLGWTYDGPFDELPAVGLPPRGKPNAVAAKDAHRVIPWDEVGETDGTGIVHIAPGCGAEDNELGKIHKLPVVAPINGAGAYLEGFEWLTGLDVLTVEKPILQNLKEKGVFFRQETYSHRYPFCWRCKQKLVFRVEDEWFLSADEIRPQMKAAAETVHWVPESVGKRTQDWYNNMGDWCISRKRFWGLPLPFYFCPDRHLTVIGGRAELRERAVDPAIVDGLPELHRPWIDEVKIRCAECGKEAGRIVDVGDCWLDAGIVAFSTLKYFEDRAYWEKWFPAELVIEMREQVRLWFYAMMFTSVALAGRPPYKAVFAYEKVYDEKGKPMHKSTGNAIWFDDAVEKMGADVMRWLYCAFNPNNNLRFGYHIADEIRKRIIVLWNVYGFFVTYARIDGFDPATAQIDETLGKSPNPLDRWILSALYTTVAEITAGLDEHDVARSIRRADVFLEALSTWYLRRSRRRCWKSEADEDKIFAYRTLFHVLVTFSKAMAPFVPFLTDEIYRNLTRTLRAASAGAADGASGSAAAAGSGSGNGSGSSGGDGNSNGAWPASVHLCDWPEVRRDLIDEPLNTRMDKVLTAVSLGRAAREKVQIRVRQPLARMWLLSLDGSPADLDQDLLSQIAQELNVKDVILGGDVAEIAERQLKLNFPVLGAKLGPAMKDVSKAAKDGAWELTDGGNLRIAGHTLTPGEYELQYAGRDGKSAAQDRNLLVVIDTEITDALKREGHAREVVRVVQDLRKKAGYNVEDRIVLFYETEDAVLKEVFSGFGGYISEETLSTELRSGRGGADQEEELVLDGAAKVWVGVKR